MGPDGDRAAGRLARGCRCFAIAERGQVVAYGWVSTGPEWVGELGVEMRPAANEAYVWNCFTLPEHRRRGHYRSLLTGIVAAARAEGLARLWIGSIEDPAEKTDAEVGFTPVMVCLVTTVLGLRWLRIQPVAGAGPELVQAARARVAPVRPLTLARSRIH